ncbi:MAG: hypothetical protein AAF799_18620 [Myxococcota bacterium]
MATTSPSSHRHRCALALIGVLGVACAPEYRYETEQVRVALTDDFDAGFCAGDMQFLQNQVDRVEERLGLQMRSPVDVVLYLGDPEGCSGTAAGCYQPGRHRISSNVIAINHELVHAVTWNAKRIRGDTFFSEGIAEALESSERFPRRVSLPSENLGRLQSSNVSYPVAGHFTRWLLEEHGPAAIMSLLDGADFSAVYGESILTAEERWLETAPWFYPRIDPCPHAPLHPSEDGWHETITLDCSADDTFSYGFEQLSSCRSFDIPEEGLYLLESELPGFFSRCNPDIIQDPLEPDPDAVPVTSQVGIPIDSFLAGEREVFFRAGPHWVCVRHVGDQESFTADLDLSPTSTTIARPY